MCDKCKCRCTCPLETSAIVISATATLKLTSAPALTNKEYFTLLVSQPLDVNDAATALLPLTITIGTTVYPLIDRAGDIVRVGQFRGSRTCGCNVKPARYRIQYGSDGMPAAIKHFTVHEGLCPLFV